MRPPTVLAVLDAEVLVASRSQPGVAWRVQRSHVGAHRCPCPARTHSCAHVMAVTVALDALWVAAGPGPVSGCDEAFDDPFDLPWSNRVGAP